MGAWGHESCSSDSCWDMLGDIGINEIHNMKQAKVDSACQKLENFISKKRKLHIEDIRDIVGCVIWFLRHEKKVSKNLLEKVIPLVQRMIEEEDYDDWSSAKKRKRNVQKEANQIAQAFESDGTIVGEHIPGLFEKFYKKINS